MFDGLESDIGHLGGVWSSLGQVLVVLEEILGVLEVFGSLLETSGRPGRRLGGVLGRLGGVWRLLEGSQQGWAHPGARAWVPWGPGLSPVGLRCSLLGAQDWPPRGPRDFCINAKFYDYLYF